MRTAQRVPCSSKKYAASGFSWARISWRIAPAVPARTRLLKGSLGNEAVSIMRMTVLLRVGRDDRLMIRASAEKRVGVSLVGAAEQNQVNRPVATSVRQIEAPYRRVRLDELDGLPLLERPRLCH